ncbi:hypothetical protein FACS1894180_2290 [Bacteroidia bacterium]|nr:hypothetical protein FACS1894180_2290 [Bacteroidia bacterium]
MKKLLIILGFIFSASLLSAQSLLPQSKYYYANGIKQYWTDDSTSVNIIVRNMQNYNAIVQNLELLFANSNDEVLADDEDDNIIVNSLSLPSMYKDSIIAAISVASDDIAFFTYSKIVNNERIWLRNDIYVKPKIRGTSLPLLYPVIQNYNNISVIEEEEDFRITCATEYDAVTLANLLHDTTLAAYSTLDFYSDIKLNTSDPLFDQQWGIKNTRQNGGRIGMDIKAEQAWTFLLNVRGNLGGAIKVAVVDDGVEEHEDLYYPGGINKVLTGWTVNGLGGTGRPESNGRHGQCCAGIISATHNTIGIAGVAPNSQIVPIRIFKNGGNPFSNAKIARGITRAWTRFGAKILSNSWGGGAENSQITNAIDDAVNNGIVVVFSSGNNNASTVSYPACLSNVIAVGANDRYGYRANFSNYGTKLDIVAPGVDVSTIDREGNSGYNSGNYYSSFGGTSAACPHVAGVASLVVSANPNLSGQQVRDIIESTAQKVNYYEPYSPLFQYIYQLTSGKPNGAWNNEMGYGLVDAHKAVVHAFMLGSSMSISGHNNLNFCSPYTYTCNIYRPELFTYEWSCNSNLTIISSNQSAVNIIPVNAGTGTITVHIYNQGRLMYTLTKNVTVNATGLPTLTPITSTNISANTTWTGNYLLVGSVAVQSGTTLTITSNIYCRHSAPIIVKPGGKLIINGATLTNACSEEFWQGIIVMGDTTKPLNPTYQGYVEINNSTIDYAACGITVNGGGIVNANNAHFVNNISGIKFNPITTVQSGTSGTFTNTTFEINGYFPYDLTDFQSHLSMINSGNIDITNCNFLSNQAASDTKNNSMVTFNTTVNWSNNNNSIEIPIKLQSNSILNMSGTAKCGTNSKILVRAGGKLILNGATLTNLCAGEMWQGIELENSENLQSTILEMNNSLIENAVCAVKTIANSSTSKAASVIATNSTFKNNGIALNFGENNPSQNTASTIKSTNFQIDNNYLGSNNVTPNDHILVKLYGTNNKIFSGCNFTVVGAKTWRGVVAEDAGFTVREKCNSGNYNVCDDCPTSYTRSYFSGFDKAIDVNNAGNQVAFKVKRTYFAANNTRAINVVSCNNYSVTYSNFDFPEPVIKGTAISCYGIYSQNASGYTISDNTFYQILSNQGNSNTGIVMKNSGISNNRIHFNQFENMDLGVYVLQTNGASNGTSGLTIVCNDFIGGKYDIVLERATIHPEQGNASSGANNSFVGTQTSSIYSTGNQQINYYYKNAAPFIPYNPSTAYIRLQPTTTTLASNCRQANCLIAILPEKSLQQYQQLQNDNEDGVNDLEMLQLSNAAVHALMTDSIEHLKELQQWYSVINTPIAKYSLAETHFALAEYKESERVLAELPAKFKFEEDEKKEHENYMRFYHFTKKLTNSNRSFDKLSESEILELETIASATTGRSATMAQGVLCFFYGICFEEEEMIEDIGDKGNTEHSPQNAPKNTTIPTTPTISTTPTTPVIYPNPTNGMIYFDNIEGKTLSIYDESGKLLQTTTSNFFDLSKYPNGNYYLKIENQSFKVVKQ